MNNFLIKSHFNDLDATLDSLFKPLFYDEKWDSMKTDIVETDAGYELDVEMPGFDKDDINISLEDGYLTISAERVEKEEKGKFLRKERSVTCQRSYYVADIEESDIKANYKNGVLSVNLPKKEPQKPQKRTITID